MAIFKVFTLSIKNTVRLKRFELNVPEEFVFPHIAALFVSRYVKYGFAKEAPHCTKKQVLQVRSSF